MVATIILIAIGLGVAALGLGLGVAAGRAAKKTEEKKKQKELLEKERQLQAARAAAPQEYNMPYRPPIEPFAPDGARGFDPNDPYGGQYDPTAGGYDPTDPNYAGYGDDANQQLPQTEAAPPRYYELYPDPEPNRAIAKLLVDLAQQDQPAPEDPPAGQGDPEGEAKAGDEGKEEEKKNSEDEKENGKNGKKGKKGKKDGGETEDQPPKKKWPKADELPGMRKLQLKREDVMYQKPIQSQRDVTVELLKQIRYNDRQENYEVQDSELQAKHAGMDVPEETMPESVRKFRELCLQPQFGTDMMNYKVSLDFPGQDIGLETEPHGYGQRPLIKGVEKGRAAGRAEVKAGGYIVAVDDIEVKSEEELKAALEHLKWSGKTDFNVLVSPSDPSYRKIWKDDEGHYHAEDVDRNGNAAGAGDGEAAGAGENAIRFTGEDGAIPDDLLLQVDALHSQWVEEQEGIAALNTMNPDIHRRPMNEPPGLGVNAGFASRDPDAANNSPVRAFGNTANTYDALNGNRSPAPASARRPLGTPGTAPPDGVEGSVSPQYAAHEAYVSRLLHVRSPEASRGGSVPAPRRANILRDGPFSHAHNEEAGLPMHHRRVHEKQDVEAGLATVKTPERPSNHTADLSQALHPLFPHTNHPPQRSPLRERVRPPRPSPNPTPKDPALGGSDDHPPADNFGDAPPPVQDP
eukprot:TRINITY_DN5908_c0_g1_i1.p1 TRINITY_DN5908_c0_g1~~TRINITY_DN5908_c0_g1_i1.p1  ORF type:complete len:689 (+),score=198.07 TRINITY_DN5908_c0_g1_i1:114-2180(+)